MLLDELIEEASRLEKELVSLSFHSRALLSSLGAMRQEVYVYLSCPQTRAELAKAAPELAAASSDYWQKKKSVPEEKELRRAGGRPNREYTEALNAISEELNNAISLAAENEPLKSMAPDFMEKVVWMEETTKGAKNAYRDVELAKQASLSLRNLLTWKKLYPSYWEGTPEEVSQLRGDILMVYLAFISTLGKKSPLTVGERKLLREFITDKATVVLLRDKVVALSLQATEQANRAWGRASRAREQANRARRRANRAQEQANRAKVRANRAKRQANKWLEVVDLTIFPLEELLHVGEMSLEDVPKLRATLFEGYKAVNIAQNFIQKWEASQASSN